MYRAILDGRMGVRGGGGQCWGGVGGGGGGVSRPKGQALVGNISHKSNQARRVIDAR